MSRYKVSRERTHCNKGHAYAEHGRVYPSGKVCLACVKERQAQPKYKAWQKSWSSKYYEENKEILKERSVNYAKNNPDRVHFLAAKHRAKAKGLDFDLTLDYISSLPKPTVCPVLGVLVDQLHLDRKDNNLGYIQGNVFFISRRANVLKNDGTVEEFKKIIKYMEGS